MLINGWTEKIEELESERTELLEALKNLVKSPVTWIDGYKPEVDYAMRQAWAATKKAERGENG